MGWTSRNARHRSQSTLHAHAVRFAVVLLAWGLIASATPALAQSSGNACLQQATGLNNPSCTANDVRISHLEVVTGPSSCDPANTTPITVTLKATIESGPDRYDIGIWLNTAGGSARSDPSGNNCYRDFLHPVDGMTSCQQQGGPYYNADGDNCGDVYAENTNPCGNAVT